MPAVPGGTVTGIWYVAAPLGATANVASILPTRSARAASAVSDERSATATNHRMGDLRVEHGTHGVMDG